MDIVTPLQHLPDEEGYYYRVELDDGSELALVPLTEGRVRVTLGPASRWQSWSEGW